MTGFPRDLDQRYYASMYGRFNTVDPMAASANASNPGSWNRYNYTLGDPVNHHDPRGLDGGDDSIPCQDGLTDSSWADGGTDCVSDGGPALDDSGNETFVSEGGGGGSLDPCTQIYSGLFEGSVNCASSTTTLPAPVIPVQPQPQNPKCWQSTGNIAATLENLGSDIEADVESGPNGTFSPGDLLLLTAFINSDVITEMNAIGGGTTASPYYIGGHFNLTISAAQIADFSTSDRQTFALDFWGGSSDGIRQAASTGLAAAGNYWLHSHGGVNAPYSFHFDRFNPLWDVSGLVGHGVYDVLGGHLGHPCLDPAWH